TAAVKRSSSEQHASEAQMHSLGGEWHTFVSHLSDFGTKIGEIVVPALTWLMGAVNELFPVIGGFAKWLVDFIASTQIVKFVGLVISGIGGLASWLSGAWKVIKNDPEKAFDDILTFLESLPGKLLHAGEDLGKALVKGVASGLSSLPGVVGHALSHIPVVGGLIHAGGSVLHALGLASGGVVVKPTLAMIGEGNQPEAVLPLSQLRQLLAGQQGTFGTQAAGGSMVQASGGKGGLTIENLNINGRSRTDAEIVNDVWLRMRPY